MWRAVTAPHTVHGPNPAPFFSFLFCSRCLSVHSRTRGPPPRRAASVVPTLAAGSAVEHVVLVPRVSLAAQLQPDDRVACLCHSCALRLVRGHVRRDSTCCCRGRACSPGQATPWWPPCQRSHQTLGAVPGRARPLCVHPDRGRKRQRACHSCRRCGGCARSARGGSPQRAQCQLGSRIKRIRAAESQRGHCA